MTQETLRMSRKERERVILLRQVETGEMLLKEAAWQMRVSVRQAIRIKKRFEARGTEGVLHAARDMPPNNAYKDKFRRLVLKTYKEKYPDFGPTLACEKMAEREKIEVNRETLRQWLIDDCQWQVGVKQRVHRQKRKRRESFGQMLQIDGSDHAWFEERGPKCTLMVLVDDATNTMALHMAPAETTEAALTVLKKWVEHYGVPATLYADRRTVYFTEEFVYNPDRRDDPETFTKFMCAADRLGIAMIPAFSPQAKGRVERTNGLLQDRLVKELRLRGIDTIDGANPMLDAFAREMNRRFAKEPARPADAHRRAPTGRHQWEYCFCVEERRTVRRDNTVVFENESWQILAQEDAPRPGDTVIRRAPIGQKAPYWLFREKRLKVRHLGCAKPQPVQTGASPRAPGI
jgi:hypothetical protein